MPTLPAAFPPGPAALVVAHPGHELRVHGWLEVARPEVFVLTDGSGPANLPRLPSTTTVIESAGARPGAIYGRCTDAAFYAALLEGDVSLFTGLTGELARALVVGRIDCVIGDAAEGYSPTHDVCRLLIDAATRIASRIRNAPIANYQFVLVGPPDPPTASRQGSVCLELDATALQRKLRVALGYPEMAGEVGAALKAWGAEAFGNESFQAVDDVSRPPHGEELPPYYEKYGEARVNAGTYGRVIRYREHVRPLAEALHRYADGFN